MSPLCRHQESCKHLFLLASLIWHGLCSLPSSCEQFPVFASARRDATSPASRRLFLWGDRRGDGCVPEGDRSPTPRLPLRSCRCSATRRSTIRRRGAADKRKELCAWLRGTHALRYWASAQRVRAFTGGRSASRG